MALPKRKMSKSRRDRRRAHDKISGPQLTKCPSCGEARLPHNLCPKCGNYKGRLIIEPKEA